VIDNISRSVAVRCITCFVYCSSLAILNRQSQYSPGSEAGGGFPWICPVFAWVHSARLSLHIDQQQIEQYFFVFYIVSHDADGPSLRCHNDNACSRPMFLRE